MRPARSLVGVLVLVSFGTLFLLYTNSSIVRSVTGSVFSRWQSSIWSLYDPEPENVLLVTAYFPFGASKHSHGEYDEWMRLFLETMHADVFMFTTPELADTARRLRGPLPLIVDTRWSTPKDIPPLASPKRREQLAAQQEKDREKAYHNADLYAVWAAKVGPQ